MDINSSYGLQGLSSVQAGQLEKLSSASAVEKTSEDTSGLAISENLIIQKSSLSQQIENMSSGIAMGKIAQNALSTQTQLLENMKAQTLKATDETAAKEVSQQISQSIEQFNTIADTTRYNSQTLLRTDGTIKDDLTMVSDGTIIPMEKADTRSVSDELSSFMNNFATDTDAREGFLTALDNGISKLNTYAADFASASKEMELNVKDALSAEKDASAAKSSLRNIDYAKESADFNKTNLQSQIGYLMQTQANAQQAKNIVLLS